MKRLLLSENEKKEILNLYYKKILLEGEIVEKKIEKRVEFESGKWSREGGKVEQILGPYIKEMEDFLRMYDESEIEIILSSSESRVPNRDAEDPKKPRLKPKELSVKRYQTIEEYINEWLDNLYTNKYITITPEIKKLDPIIGGPKWKKGMDPDDKEFKKHQWLKITIIAKYEEPDPENQTVNTRTNRRFGERKTKSGKSFAYLINDKWPENGVWKDVDGTKYPSGILTNAGTISLDTDLTNYSGPGTFSFRFIGKNCENFTADQLPDPIVSADAKSINTKFCDKYSVTNGNGDKLTYRQWQYVYMYVKKEDRALGTNNWSFIDNVPSNLLPNLSLNGDERTPGYTKNTKEYYY